MDQFVLDNSTLHKQSIMKFLAALLASAAVASANTVIYPDGIERVAPTPEVAAATAAHLALKPFGFYNGYYGGLYGAYGAYPKRNAKYYGYPYGHPHVYHPNGAIVPLEPKDVVDARIEHLKAHAEA